MKKWRLTQVTQTIRQNKISKLRGTNNPSFFMPRQKRIITIKPKGLIARTYNHCHCEKLGFPAPRLLPYANPSTSCSLKYGQVTQPSPITRTALETQKGGTYLGTATTDPTVYSRFQRFTNVDFGFLSVDRINVIGTLPTPNGMYVIVGRVADTQGFTAGHKIYAYDDVNCSLSFVRNLYSSNFLITPRKLNGTPGVETIGDFYDQQTNQYVLTFRNNSAGAGVVFSNSYTRLSVDSSGALAQIEVTALNNASPAALRATDGTLQTSTGITFPLNLAPTTATSGTIQQTRFINTTTTFTLFFGTSIVRSEAGRAISVKGFYNRHNNTAFMAYHAQEGTTTAKFGWLTTDSASTTLLDQQHFTQPTALSGDGYQFDGRFYAHFGSNSFGDIFMTADYINIATSRGLLWLQQGKRTFVELPVPFSAFAVTPSFRLNSCNVHNHATERKVSTWYSDNQPNVTGAGLSVVLAEYTIQ